MENGKNSSVAYRPHTHTHTGANIFFSSFFPSEHVNFGSEWEEEKRREKFLFVLAPEEN
jgi:hypothetical protein